MTVSKTAEVTAAATAAPSTIFTIIYTNLLLVYIGGKKQPQLNK